MHCAKMYLHSVASIPGKSYEKACVCPRRGHRRVGFDCERPRGNRRRESLPRSSKRSLHTHIVHASKLTPSGAARVRCELRCPERPATLFLLDALHPTLDARHLQAVEEKDAAKVIRTIIRALELHDIADHVLEQILVNTIQVAEKPCALPQSNLDVDSRPVFRLHDSLALDIYRYTADRRETMDSIALLNIAIDEPDMNLANTCISITRTITSPRSWAAARPRSESGPSPLREAAAFENVSHSRS